jgi:hypothetical protein
VSRAALPVADLAAFLRGCWRLTRRFVDAASTATGRMDGAACFEPAPWGLNYVEQGILAMGDYRGEATRRYRFTACEGSRADILFDDGAPFHALDLATGRAEIVHHCGDDLYEGRYAVLSADQWTLDWRITGPRKALAISTRYARLDAAPSGLRVAERDGG